MRRLGKVVAILIAVGVVLGAALLLIAPSIVARYDQELTEWIAARVGVDIDVESLELSLSGPGLRVRGLAVGRPRIFASSDVGIQVDVMRSLRAGRLQVTATGNDVVIDLRGESGDDGEDEPGSSGDTALAVDLEAAVDGVRVLLADEREVAARHLQADLALDGDAISGDATADALELRWRDRVTVFDSVLAVASWRDDTLIVDRLRADGAQAHLDAAPSAEAGATERGFAATALQIEAEVRPLVAFGAAREVDVSGRATVDLRIEGSFDDPSMRASLRVDDPHVAGLSFTTLSAETERTSGTWRARQVELRRADAVLVGDLTFDERSLRLTGDAGWREVDLGSLMSADGLRSYGDAKLDVQLDGLRAEIDARGFVEGVGRRPIPVTATVTSDGEGVAGTAEAAIDESNRLQVRIDRADASELAGEALLHVTSLETVLRELAYDGPLPARGGIDVQAKFAGTVREPRLTASLSSNGLKLADGTMAALRGDARVSRRRVDVDTLLLRVGTGELRARGGIALAADGANDWTVQASDLALGPIAESLHRAFGWPLSGTEGTATGQVDVAGSWRSPRAELELSIADARVRGVDLGAVVIDGGADDGRWRAAATAAVASDRHGEIQVSGVGSSMRELRAVVRDWPLEDVFADEQTEVGGRIDADVRLDAVGRAADGSITLTVEELELDGRRFGDSRIEAAGRGGTWEIGGRLLDDGVELDADLSTRGELPFDARMSWSDTPIPAFAVGDEQVSVSSRGTLTVRGRLTALRDAEADVAVDTLTVSSDDKRLRLETPLRAELADGRLRLEQLRLVGDDTALSVRADAAAGGPGSVTVEGSLGLDWLAHLVPAIEEAAGKVDVQVRVDVADGAVRELDGKATVRDAAVEVDGVPAVTRLRGDLAFNATEIRVAALTGELGGGRFKTSGVLGLHSGPDLEWSFNEVGLEPVRHLEMIVRGQGTLTGAWRDPPVLAGDVTIENLLYDRDLKYQDLIPSFDRAMAPALRIDREEPPVELRLRVRARDGLYVENNIARLEARADLRLRGAPTSPSLRGSIEVIDGTVSIRERPFEIENGVLSFRPDLPGQAFIDFAADSVIEAEGIPYHITVRVTGTTEDYRVYLQSEEGLSQTDIASLIAFGKTVAQIQQGGDSGPAVDRLAGIAGGQVGGLLSGEVREVLPFDEIEIRPGYSPSTGQFEPQLRVGKSITSDLAAWVGQTFGVQPQTLVEVSYALTQQISTALRWESQTQSQEGAFGGEISQRFEFWGLPRWITWGGADDAEGER